MNDYTVVPQRRIVFGEWQLVNKAVNGDVISDMWAMPGGGFLSTARAMEFARSMGGKPKLEVAHVRRRIKGQ